MKQALILVHRYVGIAISLLMAAWCLSGIVMMYVSYPALDETDRLQGLKPLDLAGCCAVEAAIAAIGDVPISTFKVEMLADRPVIRVVDDYGSVVADLRSGELVDGVGETEAARIAALHAANHGIEGDPVSLGLLEQDQWTVTGAYDGVRPFYRYAFADVADTELYVSASGGVVALDTTGRERFWNWVGAVVHWLYPAALRERAALWAQVVIWTSLIGTFLTVTGLWLGVMQIRAGRTKRFSPYRGYNWWHHVSGLVFGILTLTWVVSGLLSMTPWGLLAGSGANAEQARLADHAFTSRDALTAIAQLADLPADARQISATPLAGRLYLAIATSTAVTRVDAATGTPAPLTIEELDTVAQRIDPSTPLLSHDLLTSGDAYYYDDHDGRRSYPVYRVVLDDADQTRYYLDPATGQLLQKTDANGRWYRWLFQALHRWDFSPGLQRRPLWDLVVLPLMLGVTLLSITGVVLGFRRVKPKKNVSREA